MPTVYVTDTPLDWYGGGYGGYWSDPDWQNTSHDTGGGLPDLEPPATCWPETDSLCLTQLFTRDSVVIEEAWLASVVTPWMLAEPLRSRCENLIALFNAAYGDTGKVMRGAYNTITPDGKYHHTGYGNAGKMHIEPYLLDSAQFSHWSTRDFWKAELANTLLHEAAHLSTNPVYPHSNPDSLGFYQEEPYKSLNRGSLGTKCTSYPGDQW